MNQASNVSAIASLFAGVVGRAVLAAGKDGAADTRYKVAKLSDKLGTLKDGSKGEYVVLQREDDTAVVLNLHPNVAKKLFTKGEDAGLTLLAAETDEASTPDAAEQEALKAELAAEQAGASTEPADPATATETASTATETPAADAEPAKEPSKKERTIAIVTAGQKAGLSRKDIIAKLRTELNMGVPGANTYYQNVKSGKWA